MGLKEEKWTMKLIHDLLLTDYGLMSLIVIVIAIGMPIYIARWVMRQMAQSDSDARR